MSCAKIAIALVAICVVYTTPVVMAEAEIIQEPKTVLITGDVVASPKGTEKLQTADSFSLGHYAYGHPHGHGQVHHAHATPYYANHYTYAKYLVPTVPYTPAYYSYHYPTYGYGHGHHHHAHTSYPGYYVPHAHHAHHAHPQYLPHHHHHHGYHHHGYHGHSNYYGHHHHPHHLGHGHSIGVPVYNTRFHRFGLYH